MERRVPHHKFIYPVAGALALSLLACSDPAVEDSTVQLSYEAIPGSGITLGQGAVDMSAAVYDDKSAFTGDIFSDVVPQVFSEFGLDFAALDSEEAPGGFLVETNPSMQSRGSLTRDEASQVAAGLGYVMYQWSVLATDFSVAEGDTAYGIVTFDDGQLDPALAQLFFAHADSVDSGLGGGYMSFGDDMIFLNLRGADGEPYSGLTDEVFIDQLGVAATTFNDAATMLSETDFADAWLVENDWDAAPDGADYAGIIGASGASLATLDTLQTQFNEQLLTAATLYGWEAQPTEPPTEQPSNTQRGRFPWR